MDKQKRLPLKESKLGSAFFMIYFCAFLASALPDWSWDYGFVNISLGTILYLLIIGSWVRKDNSKQFFSIMSYCVFFTMAFVFSQPIVRLMLIAESKMWVVLIILWIGIFIFTTMMKDKIFKSFSNPGKTKASIALHLFMLFLIVITPILIFVGSFLLQQFTELNATFVICGILLYVLSLILLVILPGFLKKPEDIIVQK